MYKIVVADDVSCILFRQSHGIGFCADVMVECFQSFFCAEHFGETGLRLRVDYLPLEIAFAYPCIIQFHLSCYTYFLKENLAAVSFLFVGGQKVHFFNEE